MATPICDSPVCCYDDPQKEHQQDLNWMDKVDGLTLSSAQTPSSITGASNSRDTTTRNSVWSSLPYVYWDPILTSCGMRKGHLRTVETHCLFCESFFYQLNHKVMHTNKYSQDNSSSITVALISVLSTYTPTHRQWSSTILVWRARPNLSSPLIVSRVYRGRQHHSPLFLSSPLIVSRV